MGYLRDLYVHHEAVEPTAARRTTAALEGNDTRRGENRWESVMVIDTNNPEHKRLIETKIHKEENSGQDLWMGCYF